MHRVFPVEEVGELHVVYPSVVVDVAVVKQLHQLFIVDGNIKLQARLV